VGGRHGIHQPPQGREPAAHNDVVVSRIALALLQQRFEDGVRSVAIELDVGPKLDGKVIGLPAAADGQQEEHLRLLVYR
jgi:hypothetical protein